MSKTVNKTLIISILAAIVNCAPLESDFEIEKQNLVRFPEDPKENESITRSDTQRILDEIEKINIKLGYKKQIKPTFFLNPNQYLYPKPSYNSFGYGLVGGGTKLEPSIRGLLGRAKSKGKIGNKYYRIPLHVPQRLEKSYTKSNNTSVIQVKGYKIVGLFEKNNKLIKSMNVANATKGNVKIFLIPFNKLSDKQGHKTMNLSDVQSGRFWEAIDFRTYKEQDLKSQRTISKTNSFKSAPRPVNISKPLTVYSNIPKPINQSKPSILFQSIQSSLNSIMNKPVMNKPTGKPITQNVMSEKKTSLTTTMKPTVTSTSKPKDSDESYYNDSEEKGFLQAIKKQQQTIKDQNEVLKEGGIIIQRLKVRKGGIAIAGPGGIATAGSGGTAIVGPGGYALTHPKSLTIAGPGAKIIAYPSETNLQEVLSDDNLIKNGTVVATGPTVYYNNYDS